MFIKPCHGRVTSNFNLKRLHPISKKVTPHYGTDFGSDSDNRIFASADGVVARVDYLKDSYGHFIYIDHVINGIKYNTTYAHLKSISVRKGQVVKRGDVIGVKGSTGNSTGTHLHFEIHKGGRNGWSNVINPVTYIDAVNAPPPIDKYPKLKSVSSHVGAWQTKLLKLGYYTGKIDNSFGYATDKATRSFQKDHNLSVDGQAGQLTQAKADARLKVKRVYLPKVSSWRIYPTNKTPTKGNEVGFLNPKKFGGLSYDVLATPQKDIVTIQTKQFGKVNIFVGAGTGATIK